MLAIDSSTKKTAYAVFDNGEYKESKLIDLEKDKNMDSRFEAMSLSLINALNEYKRIIVYIEEAVVVRNAQTQRFLTRLQGVIYGYCILNQCEFNAIRPTEWRKLVSIDQGKKKREELKQESIKKVEEEFGLTVNDDEAEAILIGIAAIKKFNP